MFKIFRVEAIIIVQRKEVPYRQWRNFRPKMGVQIFVLKAMLECHDVPRCIKWPPPSLYY